MLKPLIKLRIVEWEMREGKEFVQKDAAAAIGISAQYLGAIIKGKKVSGIDTEILYKIARYLGCKVDELYEYKEE